MTPTDSALIRIRAAIDQAVKLRQKATPGPWSAWNAWTGSDNLTHVFRIGPPSGAEFPNGLRTGGGSDITGRAEDFLFIVHARNVAMEEALRVAVEALAQIVRMMRSADRHTSIEQIELGVNHDALFAIGHVAGLLPVPEAE